MANNPFTPTDPITRPEDFIGRSEQLKIVIDALIHGTNVLLTGYRGIGKTSLADQTLVALRTKGRSLIAQTGISFPPTAPNIASYTCSSDSSLADIAEGLLASLRRNMGATTKAVLKGEINLGFAKGSVELKDAEFNIKSVSALFVNAISELIATAHSNDGFTYFLIDEIDVLADSVLLGAFVKVVKESFRNEGKERFAFLLVGQRGVAQKLIRDHPSVGRTLTFVDIPRMTNGEIGQIFSRAAQRANLRFDPGVISEISALAHGFPSVAQLIGYQCYFVDVDGFIDVLDFESAVSRAAEKLRAERYVADVKDVVQREPSLKILSFLCDESDDVINIRNLASTFGETISDESFRAELNLLSDSDLIEWVDKNSIKLKDRLIAIYYFLRSIRIRSTELIKTVVDILQRRGYKCRVGGIESDRLLDIIATKEIAVFLFLKRQFRIGVICLPSHEIVPESLVSNISENCKSILQKYSLEFLIAASGSSLRDPAAIDSLATVGVRLYTLEELTRMKFENY